MTPALQVDLSGRTVLLTGATSALGSAFARALAGANARLALVARRRDLLDALAADLDDVVVIVADLDDTASLASVVDEARRLVGPIDTLINVAARSATAVGAESETLEQITGTLTVNVTAPLVLAQLVYPDMRAAGQGCIVNIGSIVGEVGVGRFPQASYAASKGALHALTRELAAQWSRHGIRVNCLAPGFFRSEMTAPLFDSPKAQEWIRRGEMLPRHAEADDLVGALLFLVSDASATMTGQVMVVDNGWTAR
jgi:NAD(P)-dependent dehydrogenase (short-subunit alcohol dehydrogenase family)